MVKNMLYRRLLLLRTVFHSVFLLSNAAILLHTLVVMVQKTNEPGVSERLLDMRDNAPAFFTNWNITFQITFLIIAVCADGLEWNGRGHRLRTHLEQARDVLFCAVIVPYGVFVTVSFWLAYSFDRELVFPRVFDEALPSTFNHCVHTTITVMLVLEILQHPRPYPTNRKYEEALYWTVISVYSVIAAGLRDAVMVKNMLYRRLLLLRTVFHSVFLLSNAAILLHTLVVMVQKTNEPGVSERLLDMRDNAPAFFTNWNITFQITFLIIAVCADGLEWNGRGHRLRTHLEQARDVLFCAVIVPYGVFVTVSFWLAYSFDRELVFPRVFDEALPSTFNHCVHTTITVMLVLEILQHPRPYPTNRKYEEALYWTVISVYSVMLHTLHLVTGHWLYKIIGLFNWWQMILFHICIFLFPYLVYRLQFPLNRFIHHSAVDYLPAPKKDCVEADDL